MPVKCRIARSTAGSNVKSKERDASEVSNRIQNQYS
jgi:hypothetical protein